MSRWKTPLRLACIPLLWLSQSSPAQPDPFAGKTEMNGIRFDDYSGFEKKWGFVTVRYRVDSGEQRFVWANPMAEKALAEGKGEYPDGAVFAKIGVMTDEDPAFKSSRVPAGTLRYQFMVRDKSKYASTGGWGYALFDANDKTTGGDPAIAARACYACHQIVSARGQVFSQPFGTLSRGITAPLVSEAEASKMDLSRYAIRFKSIPLSEVPELARRQLPEARSIRVIDGPLRDNVFRGTIDEIRPTLIEESKKTGLPAALIAADGRQFSIVYPVAAGGTCPKGTSMKSVFSAAIPKGIAVAFEDLCL